MPAQLAIDFTPAPAPYQRHSATSKAAARAVEPRTGTDRARVLAYIRSQGTQGATDDEVQAYLGMDGSTQRPRRVSLACDGFIVRTSAQRETRKGSLADVWVAVR